MKVPDPLFTGLEQGFRAGRYHSWVVSKENFPDCLEITAEDVEEGQIMALRHREYDVRGIQFHPEVLHTQEGTKMLHNFVRGVCGCAGTWRMDHFVEHTIEAIREKVGDAEVICGLSGGVDSAVAAALVHKAIGDQLTCVFVDHGLLRKGEAEQVKHDFVEATAISLFAFV